MDPLHSCFLSGVRFIKVEAKQNKSNMDNEMLVGGVSGAVGNGAVSKAQHKNR